MKSLEKLGQKPLGVDDRHLEALRVLCTQAGFEPQADFEVMLVMSAHNPRKVHERPSGAGISVQVSSMDVTAP